MQKVKFGWKIKLFKEKEKKSLNILDIFLFLEL